MTHRDGADPIPVPRDVLDGIEAVRRSGRVNMLDRPAVVRLADQLGHPAATIWIHEHPGDYARGVFHAFRAEPERDDDDRRAIDDDRRDADAEPLERPDPGAPDA